MTQRMTVVTLPGLCQGHGFQDYGRVEPEKMIRTLRDHAQRQFEASKAIFEAADEDFRVAYVEGITIGKHLETLQEGKKL